MEQKKAGLLLKTTKHTTTAHSKTKAHSRPSNLRRDLEQDSLSYNTTDRQNDLNLIKNNLELVFGNLIHPKADNKRFQVEGRPKEITPSDRFEDSDRANKYSKFNEMYHRYKNSGDEGSREYKEQHERHVPSPDRERNEHRLPNLEREHDEHRLPNLEREQNKNRLSNLERESNEHRLPNLPKQQNERHVPTLPREQNEHHLPNLPRQLNEYQVPNLSREHSERHVPNLSMEPNEHRVPNTPREQNEHREPKILRKPTEHSFEPSNDDSQDRLMKRDKDNVKPANIMNFNPVRESFVMNDDVPKRLQHPSREGFDGRPPNSKKVDVNVKDNIHIQEMSLENPTVELDGLDGVDYGNMPKINVDIFGNGRTHSKSESDDADADDNSFLQSNIGRQRKITILPVESRKNLQKCLGKKATKICGKSCISAYKNVCTRLKCTSRSKKALKKECKRSCKKSFATSKYSSEED